mmetsp:Transcript_16184/g.32216  ORF Transcript_16184/g.32216 Transcript_16184/m.32216 type:complete len:153 (+) Transcript_16184:2010-2468(+)
MYQVSPGNENPALHDAEEAQRTKHESPTRFPEGVFRESLGEAAQRRRIRGIGRGRGDDCGRKRGWGPQQKQRSPDKATIGHRGKRRVQERTGKGSVCFHLDEVNIIFWFLLDDGIFCFQGESQWYTECGNAISSSLLFSSNIIGNSLDAEQS